MVIISFVHKLAFYLVNKNCINMPSIFPRKMGETENGAAGTSAEPAAKKQKSDPTVLEQEFDKETQSALEEIDSCQNEIDAMNEKASEEILKVMRVFIFFF